MEIVRNKIILGIFILFIGNVSYTQNLSPPDTGKFVIYESLNDSIDLANDFYNFYDSLAIYFHPSANLYDNWNTEEIKYVSDSAQITEKFLETLKPTVLSLIPPNTNPYFHPFCGRVTSKFGYRRYRYHYGIDLDLNTGDTVRSAFDGTVRISKYHNGYGNVIVVRHHNGLETVYAHLNKMTVDTGYFVNAGDVLGLGGNTGRSNGSHLHFEVRYQGAPMNPEYVIDFSTCTLKSEMLIIDKQAFKYISEISDMKSAKYHTIRSGDTLGGIARKYKTSVSKLCNLNGIKQTTLLQLGRKLRVR